MDQSKLSSGTRQDLTFEECGVVYIQPLVTSGEARATPPLGKGHLPGSVDSNHQQKHSCRGQLTMTSSFMN